MVYKQVLNPLHVHIMFKTKNKNNQITITVTKIFNLKHLYDFKIIHFTTYYYTVLNKKLVVFTIQKSI